MSPVHCPGNAINLLPSCHTKTRQKAQLLMFCLQSLSCCCLTPHNSTQCLTEKQKVHTQVVSHTNMPGMPLPPCPSHQMPCYAQNVSYVKNGMSMVVVVAWWGCGWWWWWVGAWGYAVAGRQSPATKGRSHCQEGSAKGRVVCHA